MKILWKNALGQVAITTFASKFIAAQVELKTVYDTYNDPVQEQLLIAERDVLAVINNRTPLQNNRMTEIRNLLQTEQNPLVRTALSTELDNLKNLSFRNGVQQARYVEIIELLDKLQRARAMKLIHGLSIPELATKMTPPERFTFVEVGDIPIPATRANRDKWRLGVDNRIVELPVIPGPPI